MIKLLTLIAVMLLGFLIVACEPGGDSQVFQYDVVFDLDGGAPNIETQTIWENRTAKRPIDPVKEGYEFLYWANSATLTKWDFVNDRVKEDLTLIAIWGEMHLVIFDLGFENKILDQFIVSDETKLEQPQTPIRNGYTFNGWTLNDEIFDFETVITEDTKLLASWNANQYKITFDSNGGSLVDPIIQDFDTPINKPNDPLLEGHRFLGWFIDEALTEEYTFTTMPANDLTLYADWIIDQYTITFESNEGPIVNPITQAFNTVVNKPNPSLEGYSFIGWFVDEALTEAYQFTTMPANNLTLYASWSINTYTISFNTDGGDAIASINLEYNESISLPTPNKDSWNFVDWQLDGQLFELTNMPAYDIEVVAIWTQITTFTVTFNTNEGTTINPIIVVAGDTLTLPEAPIKDGFEFVGWFTDEALTLEFEETTAINADTTLYAKWEEESTEPVEEVLLYETGFESSEEFSASTTYNNTTIKYTGSVGYQWGTYYGTPSTTGSITGSQSMQMRWYTSATNNRGYTFTDFDLKNISKVEFSAKNTNRINVIVEVSKDSGLTWESPETFVLTTSKQQYTYNISDEYRSDNNRIKFTITYTNAPTGTSNLYIDDVKIYGLVSGEPTPTDEYIVSFNTDGGSTIEDIIVKDGNKAIAPREPTKAGFKFIGWFIDDEEFDFDTPITSDLTLTAKWEEDETAPVTNETYLETFDNITISGSQYTNGSFSGVNNQLWNHTDSRGDMSLDGKALLLRVGSLTTTFTEGLSAISFDYQRAFTGTSARSFEVYINGALIETITVVSNSDTRGTFTLNNLNYTGEVQLEIKGLGAQKLIDNLSWTTNK